jgi:selenide,water dikinase
LGSLWAWEFLSAVLKKGKLFGAGYHAMLDWTTRLNTPGAALAELPASTRSPIVTGFGLAGHLLEICAARSSAAKCASTRCR